MILGKRSFCRPFACKILSISPRGRSFSIFLIGMWLNGCEEARRDVGGARAIPEALNALNWLAMLCSVCYSVCRLKQQQIDSLACLKIAETADMGRYESLKC